MRGRERHSYEWAASLLLPEPDPEEKHRPALVVAGYATGPDDLRDLLQVIGLAEESSS